MPSRAWLTATAFGIALSFQALAQEAIPSPSEGEPVSEPRQEESAPAGEQRSAQEEQTALDVVPALDRIETAIRELIAEEDQIQRREQEARENRDLAAQEEMAKWAMWMFWATFATVLLTFAALAAIIRTLHHTRRAADYAKDMVAEAKETTKAARDSVGEARKGAEAASAANILAARQFELGYKPWISVSIKGPFIKGDVDLGRFKDDEVYREVGLYADIFVHNIGEMPATIEDFSVKILAGERWPYVREQPPDWHPTIGIFHILHSKESVHIDKSGAIVTHEIPWPRELDAVRITEENRHSFTMHPPPIVGYVIYSSPLGRRYRHNFAFVGDPPWTPNFLRFGGPEYNREDPIDD